MKTSLPIELIHHRNPQEDHERGERREEMKER